MLVLIAWIYLLTGPSPTTNREDPRFLAGASLGLDGMTGGLSPNFGTIRRAFTGAVEQIAETSSRIARREASSLSTVDVQKVEVAAPDPKRVEVELTTPYGDLKGTTEKGVQANHLNQDAAYNAVIPTNEGAAIGLQGDAIRDIGSPHYEFHKSLEGFWNQYRKGGDLEGTLPTNAAYGTALENSLVAAGHSKDDAAKIAREAAANRAAHGINEEDLVPRVPGRLNQKK